MQSKSQKAEISNTSGAPGVSVASHTPTPWAWVVHDYSLATLCGPNTAGWHDGIDGHVASISPCGSCINHAEPKEWRWGRCTTIGKADAAFIVRAVNSHDALVEAVEELLATHPAAYRDAGKIDNRTDNAVKIARAALASSREVRS